jgi:hypothetical protein
LQEQKLNPRNYSEQEINIRNFVQAADNDVHMYAKFGGLTFYEFFVINYSKILILVILYKATARPIMPTITHRWSNSKPLRISLCKLCSKHSTI